jgi:hypothetical protein
MATTDFTVHYLWETSYDTRHTVATKNVVRSVMSDIQAFKENLFA